MNGLLDRSILPVRLRDDNLDILFRPAELLEDGLVQQLVDKSRQPHILEFEGTEDVGTPTAPGRFRSMEDYKRWAHSKQRFMYLLLNTEQPIGENNTPEIASISWFGNREHRHAPGRSVTFAMRTYAADPTYGWQQYAGKGLSVPFMQAAHFDARKLFENQSSWLDLVAGNEASRAMCVRAGYREVHSFADDTHDGQIRVVMANDTAFILDDQVLILPRQKIIGDSTAHAVVDDRIHSA